MRRPATQETLGVSCGRSSGQRPWRAFSTGSWASDITSIPLQHGFLYLPAVIDLYSRNVLSWRLPNTLTGDFCLEALDAALARARPEIVNTNQGAQFTAPAFTSRWEQSGIAISMVGRGRARPLVGDSRATA
jgi:transposase InsO family protein